ncbi:MAG TPA: prenyltransferase/squalene oxidase repeat-containing protein [Solirubrobacteraceae bacterium]|nr:prenyltransferase/squalene oxidase repeat-containing protein [Solirubrobacteraceae bacterium]
MSIVETHSEARIALERACEHLLALQDPGGWWRGELQTNVTMDAEDMLLREFLGIRRADETERSAVWIRSQWREDGTWSNFHGGPGDLSTTIEAYWALRLAGDPPEAEQMRTTAEWVRAAGGLEGARVFTHVWLALFGLWPWERVPALPPEIVLLPRWVPLNIYDFGCWARQTIVALSLVMTHRPKRSLPFDLRELHGPRPWTPVWSRPGSAPTPSRRRSAVRSPSRSARGLAGGAWLMHLDRALRAYERRPLRWLRRLAVARAQAWIVRRQEADGSWGGIQPPWVYSLMALHLGGYGIDHPVIASGLEGLERFMIEDRGGDDLESRLPRPNSAGRGAPSAGAGPLGTSESESRSPGAPTLSRPPGADGFESRPPSRRLEACQSPVWDTALAMVALGDGGLGREHPALARAARWLVGEEVQVRGDWAVTRPALAPGGWAFEFENDNYPDVDDTAEVVLGLLRSIELEHEQLRRANRHRRRIGDLPPVEGAPGARERTQDAIDRGIEWLEGMQSEDGGWGAFDADNTRALVRELPFLDFGEVIDEPSADVTAHALEMLAAVGRAQGEAAQRGLRWLLAHQEPDGSWFGRWGINHVYGTGAALPALVAMGVAPKDPCIRRAVRWLQEHQNGDGGWGEDPRSYDEDAWIGRGPSTASQTAWALLALHAAGERIEGSPAVERGVEWLISTQRVDGTWDEPQYTGTGFPCDYYINYHLYRLTFPIMALGRCLGTRAGG